MQAELPKDQLTRLEGELAHFRAEIERLKTELKDALDEDREKNGGEAVVPPAEKREGL